MNRKILLKILAVAVLFSFPGYSQYTGGIGSGYAMGESQPGIPLPVELVSFTAKVVSGNVVLNWTTETEVNNYGFEIERASAAPHKSWEKIGFVEGSGNSNSIKHYSFSNNKFLSGLEYYYRLKQIDTDGQYEYSNEVSVTLSVDNYELFQNYPNPFNPSTTISFSIPEEAFVKLKINDVLGNEVAVLVNERLSEGHYETVFNASTVRDGLPSGIYFYSIETGSYIKTRKMIIMK